MNTAEERKRIRRLAEAVADETPVDWAVEGHPNAAITGTAVSGTLDGLRLIESVIRVRQSTDEVATIAATATAPDITFRWGPLAVYEQVGKGSFGEVYRAVDTRLECEVALKLRRINSRDEESGVRRFLEEARRLARVRHPNVVAVHGADLHDGRIGLWTDFVRGRTLEERLTAEGPLGGHEAAPIGLELCRALAAVHSAGLIHGDLKAANVMRAEGGRILLMDFGTASEALANEATTRGATIGTPLIMAPEVLSGEAAAGPSADVYSLGVLLYRLVSGRYPVIGATFAEIVDQHRNGERPSLRDVRADLPSGFVQVVDRALALDPRARYASAGAMERALAAAMEADREALAEGKTLIALLAEVGRVPEELCRRIGREVSRALIPIHGAGEVHGALHAQGILIQRDERIELLQPGDAAIAAGMKRRLAYSAPEQRAGAGAIDERADLYALGAILYELATGRHPFSGGGPLRRAGEVNTQLSAFFEAVLHELLAERPEERFASAADLVQVLAECEGGAWWRARQRELRLATRRPLRRIRIPRETALYGRDAALAELRSFYERARGAEGQVVIVHGEVGIGKTRLLDELVTRLEREGEEMHFVFGPYAPGGAATAAGAFTTAYREHFGAAGLEQMLADYLASTPLLIPGFAAFLRDDLPPAGSQPLSRESIQTAFVNLTRGLAAERPVIVVIDDLHFAPEDGRALFAALAHAGPGHRILLVGTARPGLPAEWTAGLSRLAHVSELHLGRLGPGEVGRLLAEALGSEPLAEDLAPEVAAQSDGNPFFLLEILRELKDGGFIVEQPDGTWAKTRSIRGLPIAPTVANLVAARVDRLTEEDRELLDVAACWGFEFDPTIIAAAIKQGVVAALRRFGRVESRERLIRAIGPRYVFDHHVVQETLYAALSEPLREQYHAALAEALAAREHAVEREPRDLDGATAVALCDHYFRGGCGEQGFRYLPAAVGHLERNCRFDASIRLAEQALRTPGLLAGRRRLEILLQMAGALSILARDDEAGAAIKEAMAIAEADRGHDVLAATKFSLSRLLLGLARYSEAHAVAIEGIEDARAAGDRKNEGLLLNLLGTILNAQGNYEESAAQCARSLAIAREIGDPLRVALTLGDVGMALTGLSRFEEALAHFEQAAGDIGHRRERARVMSKMASVQVVTGRLEEAEVTFEESRAVFREIGDRHLEASVCSSQGELYGICGRFADAAACHERTLTIAREIGDQRAEARAFRSLGSVSIDRGRLEEALDRLDRSLAIYREIFLPREELAVGLFLGKTYRLLGDHARSRQWLEMAERMAVEMKAEVLQGYALVYLGSLERQAGNLATAERYLGEVISCWRRLQAHTLLPDGLVELGEVLADLGRSSEAVAALEEALVCAQRSGLPGEIVRATVTLAVLDSGKTEVAVTTFQAHGGRLNHETKLEAGFLLWKVTGDRAYLEQSHKLLAELQAMAPAEYRATMISNVPLYRDIQAAWGGRA
jgi:serine/threonine-protein kinase